MKQSLCNRRQTAHEIRPGLFEHLAALTNGRCGILPHSDYHGASQNLI